MTHSLWTQHVKNLWLGSILRRGTGPQLQENPDNKSYVIRIFKPNSPFEKFSENLGKFGKDIMKQEHITFIFKTILYACTFLKMKCPNLCLCHT